MHRLAIHLISLAAAAGLVLASLAGCASSRPGTTGAEVLKSGKARLAAPSPEQAPVSELVAGNAQFALDIYRTAFDEQANAFCSPYSISLALAMTYAGARGETAQQMAQALHFNLPQAELHPAFNALDQALAGRGQQVSAEGERFRLHVANALWGQQGFDFEPAFLDLLAENYGAGLRVLDFAAAPEPARQTINRWVEEQTESKIKDILPSGSIKSLTRLVLTNAIYFNATWMHPFQERATQDGAFHRPDGSTVTVPMMHTQTSFAYAEGQGYQAIELPYVGGEMSMVILLPAEGQFADFVAGLDGQRLGAILQALQGDEVDLEMPRFSFESGLQLRQALTELGMEQPFSMEADFSGMTGRPDLYIDDVYHKAFVSVDEKGTEAAAATAVVMDLKGMVREPRQVRVDRPFVFLIRDVQTGAILFLGHVVDPAA